MNDIMQQKTFINNTNFHILIGDYNDIISNHTTLDAATLALKSIHISDSKWTSIWIVKPGETCLVSNIKVIQEENRTTSYD
ncbi:hypothetical protein [Bacillus thuringiensis]|uniref:hypothetical protein n=1 Tax=Bacillus thuringiensis TaxID=1428 RepID=UPI0020751931|nr:hypothetical protein [Bacillus thuringiensis]MED3272499.1 hypothetical protein [Bacillus thuringiensis]